jgi:SNF2 family DNA or RNA helicase
MEQQAIGRVFRPGQTRDVRVHRILLRGPSGQQTIDSMIVERNTDEATIKAVTSN